MAEQIVIDLQDVEDKVQWHLAEASRLEDFLIQLRRFGKSEGSAKVDMRRSAVPPAGDSKIVAVLRDFILRQDGVFDHPTLKSSLEPNANKHRVRDAIRLLEDEGVLEVIKRPNGRFLGAYRRKLLTLNGKAAEGHYQPPAALTDSRPTVENASG